MGEKNSAQSKSYALVLSGGGVRATAFHFGVLLWLAASHRLDRVTVLSSVSGGSLAAGLVFTRAGLRWPSSAEFDAIFPALAEALTVRSLQGAATRRTLLRPWKLFGSRGNVLANALETEWGIHGSMKSLPKSPKWLISATCYETGRNWRLSQTHIGDWKFGHNYIQDVPISMAMAASAAIPYLAGFVHLPIASHGWHEIDPATDRPVKEIKPLSRSVRLWDGGVYENLGLEAVHKPQRGFVDPEVDFLIVSDASAELPIMTGISTGVFTAKPPFLRSPRLFDIATSQTRALRSRALVNEMTAGRLSGAILRLGRSAEYIYRQAKKPVAFEPGEVLGVDAVAEAAAHPTNAARMTSDQFKQLVRHGFETTNATLTTYQAVVPLMVV
jgi:NTE family protein